MADIKQIALPDGTICDLRDASKQPLLTAGTGISIDSNNVISATGGGGGSAVQSDWAETDTTSDAYILNKPTLGDVSALSTNGSTANYLRGDGTWVTPPNTTYSAGTGLSLSGTTFSVSKSVPSATLVTTGSVSSNLCNISRSGNVVIVQIDVTVTATGTINIITGLPQTYAPSRGTAVDSAGVAVRLYINGTTLQLQTTKASRYFGEVVYIAS